MQTLGVYIEVPFCASKCTFCNFNSQVARGSILDAYCRALEQEINRLPALYEAHRVGIHLLSLPVDSLYIGGGTPLLLGAERLERILQASRRRFDLDAVAEFTLEVTPGSADGDLLGRARALGVNRLSIGAQTFVDRELRAVGRLHSAGDTRDLVVRARRAGFTNISLDLIAGLPYQTEDSWRESLRTVGELRPAHVSVYLLEIDEKSRLGGEVLRHGTRYHASAVPHEDFMAAAYETARGFLKQQSYAQYEISNFALSGFESRHNQKYWRLEPYAGLGAGAHSYDGHCRWANETATEAYERRLAHGESPIAEVRALSPEEQLEEFFFLGLRQREGVDLALARQRWGAQQMAGWEPRIARLAGDGWLERWQDRIRLTERAILVSNEIFQEFLT